MKLLSASWFWRGRWHHRDVDDESELPASFRKASWTSLALHHAIPLPALEAALKEMKEAD